jgi:hypothetical protein
VGAYPWLPVLDFAAMHFWAPEIDPTHPMDCTQPERYVLRRLNGGAYLAIAQEDGSLLDVAEVGQAYMFHTHEAALRAATELNRLGAAVDVLKVD